MSRTKIELLIGLLVAIMPFLGFPSSWRTAILIVAGLILCIVAILSHVRAKSAPVLKMQQKLKMKNE